MLILGLRIIFSEIDLQEFAHFVIFLYFYQLIDQSFRQAA